jgi:hypothetical protein
VLRANGMAHMTSGVTTAITAMLITAIATSMIAVDHRRAWRRAETPAPGRADPRAKQQ